MTKRGRKSAASQALAPVKPVDQIPRPAPPDQLTDEEAEEWCAVVDRMPADWFARETHALLVQYCRHVIAARRIAQFIAHLQQEEELDVKGWADALKMQARESQIIATLATKMRISQQSTYDKSRKKGDGGKKKPWEV
jgi:hypothetical protein